jgi:hypothetical protein
MQQAFDNLIAQLRNPQSAETQNAMQILNTSNQSDIPALINFRMQQQPAFIDSMGLFATATFEATERAFAVTVQGLNPQLWVRFVTAVREFVQRPQQQPQQQPQQPQQPQQQQQQQPQNRHNIFSNRQQQPQQPQQQYPDAEPVLGVVNPMPADIDLVRARRIEQSISDRSSIMPSNVSESIGRIGRIGRNGGKKLRLRSKKRGLHRRKSMRRRKSIHRRKSIRRRNNFRRV